MAGRGGLRILLLWAGIIGLSKVQCQSQTATSPPLTTTTTTAALRSVSLTTAHKPPLTTQTPTSFTSNQTYNSSTVSATTPSTSPTNSSQTVTQNSTSPPVTQLITTITQAAPTQASSVCSYSVTPMKFGFQIDFLNSPSGDYNIVMTEDGRPAIDGTSKVTVSNQTSSHKFIMRLKPCTEYEHRVTLLHSDGKLTSCYCSEHKTTTTEMNDGDVKEVNDKPGHVCYQTDWDISSLQSTQSNISPQPHGNNTFCVKPGFNDICSNFILTSINCMNSSFNLAKYITAEFLNPEQITQIPSNQFPADIKAELPPNCKNLSTEYTCWEPDRDNERKTLSELEPFTDYTCTGHIKDNDVLIKNTSALHFRVDCDLTTTVTKTSPTNTSVELTFSCKTTSPKCKDNDLQKLSYSCSCGNTPTVQAIKVMSGGKCNIAGLNPYTDYKCKVQPIYNRYVLKKFTVQDVKTEAGVPTQIPSVSLHLQEHNMIKVTCEYSVDKFQGPKRKYQAQLLYGSVIDRKAEKDKCEFVFHNLRYSTTYEVQVTANNGELQSIPRSGSFTTKYNDKAVIGFLIILTSVALVVVTYKIYVLKQRRSRSQLRSSICVTS